VTQLPPPRADSVRNRSKILAAAHEQITLRGPDAGMDAIAEAAGLAVGTLYRHFATKADLVAAVVAEHVEQLADDADDARKRVNAGARALDELSGFLARVVASSASDHAVKAAVHALAARPRDHAARRAATALAELIQHAQADDDIHPDVSIADLYLLLTTAPTDRPDDDRARWLELARRAITARTP
jgi:AcrR family transcriptional regulator